MAHDADQQAQLALELQEVRAEMARLAQQLDQVQSAVARLVPANAESADQLVSIKEGASDINSTYQTVWRWANENPEALGVTRFGGKVFVSLRKLRFFARHRRPN